MTDILDKYGFGLSQCDVSDALAGIRPDSDGLREALLECFALMDLTTLHSDDTEASVLDLVDKTGGLASRFPGIPLPASICVYPQFAPVVRARRCSESLHVTAVAGCFPSSQSFPEVKILECVLAVRSGADEIDIVLALNAFCAGNYDAASDEIKAIRTAVDAEAAAQGRTVILKVILETGLLGTVENIARASFLAMEAGADFIKTSTGKVQVNATPEAAYVMCRCIGTYYGKSGRMVGFKAAGGISTSDDALLYRAIVLSVLGRDWIDRRYFRFGVSRLGNALLSAVEGKGIQWF